MNHSPQRRILVTGSRNWGDKYETPGWHIVWKSLTDQLQFGVDLVVVHGDCPTGADAVAQRWATAGCCWYDGPLCKTAATRRGWTDQQWESYVDEMVAEDSSWEYLRNEAHPMVYNEPHPADWKQHGRAAGPIRNQQMVDLGADVCLAFPLPDSRGTFDCMRRARAAGIPVIEHTPGGA